MLARNGKVTEIVFITNARIFSSFVTMQYQKFRQTRPALLISRACGALKGEWLTTRHKTARTYVHQVRTRAKTLVP